MLKFGVPLATIERGRGATYISAPRAVWTPRRVAEKVEAR